MQPMVRTAIVRASRRLHEQGWVANHDGNVSVRVGKDRFVITPTAMSKLDIDEAMLVTIDGAGKVIEGTRKPPGETELHLAAYRARPDVEAVLHAHPPYATAFGVARVPLEPLPLPEAVVSLGRVPTAPFALPKTPLATEGVARCASEANQFLLPGNGVMTLGPDLSMCLLRMELVEHVARILHLARGLGGAVALEPAAMEGLLAAHAKAFPRGK